MKRFSIVIISTILVLTLSLSVAAKSEISFDSTEIDFGEIESGKVVDVEFKFQNIGDSLLIIKNVAASCGCTATKLDKKEYQPGEKGSIPVKFYSRGYNGKITKSITVSSNDEKNVYTRLKITGKVNLKDFAAVELPKDRIDFKEVTLGKKYSETVEIKNTGSIDLRIIEVTHSPDVWPEFNQKVVAPDEVIKVNIVFKPMQAGRFATFVKIRSNAYRQRMVIIKVSAEVKDKE